MQRPIPSARAFIVFSGALLVATAAHAAAVTVYSNDFEVPATVASGVSAAFGGAGGTESSQGYSAHGFGAAFLRNDTAGNPASSTTLTLTGLPAHTSLSLGFLLAVIDSWDGTGDCGPDNFSVKVDGATVFSNNFGNVRDGSCGAHPQSYPTTNAIFFPTASNIDFTGSSTSVGFNGWNDSAYDMNLESLFDGIAHSSSVATIEFFASGDGWQAGFDESWAIDNVSVTLDDAPVNVPEPGAIWLALMGCAGLAARLRRRT